MLLNFSIKEPRTLSFRMIFFLKWISHQVNLFNCGGLVIAIQISHILADGFTLGTLSRNGHTLAKQGP
ncbi:hypothetical protein RDI58_003256 [Solanum bulbocastanum]|uniref:Uncharacterized protein n=1 Tax=Solanum bulbocastanum TaxID=147425 RepID=A0AAN8YRX9_SOLBU